MKLTALMLHVGVCVLVWLAAGLRARGLIGSAVRACAAWRRARVELIAGMCARVKLTALMLRVGLCVLVC